MSTLPLSKPISDIIDRLTGTGVQGRLTAPGVTPVPEVDSPSVKFSPFRFRVWSKSDGGVAGVSKELGGLKDFQMPIGRYIITFNVPPTFSAFEEITDEIPIRVSGKRVIIEKAKFDSDNNHLLVQVGVRENYVFLAPVLWALAGATVTAIGVGWMLGKASDTIESVDVVVVDTATYGGLIVLFTVGGYLALKLIKTRIK